MNRVAAGRYISNINKRERRQNQVTGDNDDNNVNNNYNDNNNDNSY